jgi:hypothetical protein
MDSHNRYRYCMKSTLNYIRVSVPGAELRSERERRASAFKLRLRASYLYTTTSLLVVMVRMDSTDSIPLTHVGWE